MYLGIDIGTASVKLMLIDREQRVVGTHSIPLEVERPQPGWSEQDPESWVAATSEGIDALAKQYPKEIGAVRGIGLSGQMHGATLLDKADRPLRPCILRDDSRAAEEAAELDRDPKFRGVTGNAVLPSSTAARIVWLERHEPKCFHQINKVVGPKDYVRLWLAGDCATDMSDASGTSWLDVGGRDWSDELLTATGMDRSRVPELCEGTAVSGQLRPLLAGRWGMREPVVVAGGAAECAALACALGAVFSGATFLTIGDLAGLTTVADSLPPGPDGTAFTFCHALPGLWCRSHTASAATADGRADDGAAPGLAGSLAALGAAAGNTERATVFGAGFLEPAALQAVADALGTQLDIPVEGEIGAALGAARLGLIAAENADPLTVAAAPAMLEAISPDSAGRSKSS